MKRIWQLRAYGDFTITLQSLLYSSNPTDYQIVASQHHLPLFKALSAILPQLSGLPIQFANFGINKALLRVFTNRHLLHKDTITEINAVKKFLLNNPIPNELNFIDQGHRKWLLQWGTKHKFDTIVKSEWIYADYHAFFKTEAPVIMHVERKGGSDVGGVDAANKNILILPSARIPKRNIPAQLVNELVTNHTKQGDQVSIHYFNQSPNGENTYSSFDELIQLIQAADFVYGADSLPVHLSYLLQKPHYILYPKGGSKQFFTPYTLTNHQYKTF
ncbi:MAG: hypothetical protein Q8K64_14475 [Sediminibacterium sp.]|nr:hypothetical protein [Sediminibacterium sp.]